MSKNLKKQWEEELVADIPDLWSRIEANLPEKNHPTVNEINLSKESKTVSQTETGTLAKKKNTIKRILPVFIAAAVLFIVVFPVFLLPAGLRIIFGGNKNSADATMNDAMGLKQESAGGTYFEECNEELGMLPAEETNDAEYFYSTDGNQEAVSQECVNADSKAEECGEEESVYLATGIIVYMEEAIQSNGKTIWSVRFLDDVQGEEPFGKHTAGELLSVTICQDTKEIPQEGKEYRVSFLKGGTDSEYFEICLE